MECKDCVNFNDCKNVAEEVCEDFKFNADSELIEDNITSIAPEETEETTEETPAETTEINFNSDELKESISKLANTVSDLFNKKPAPKQETQPIKKPFKIGFWGYLTIGAIIKGAVEITRAITDTRRPRR